MHKAIAIIQFKCEGQLIKAHPEFGLGKRLLFDKIDFDRGTVEIEGKTWDLSDTNFPTINKNDPYALSEGEILVMHSFESSGTRPSCAERRKPPC